MNDVDNGQCFRYRDVYPYDHSRVPLSNVAATDYINASLVSVDTLDRSYILTQEHHCNTDDKQEE